MSLKNLNMKSRKFDVLLAFLINIVFLTIYVRFFQIIQESNDDLAMSYLVEGAYGERLEYLIFENVLWGKVLKGLYTLLPQFKWYNITFFAMTLVAFWEMTYVFLRTQGRRIGTAISCIMLMVCGYHSYVMFQFSRVTTITTAGGMILLFFALQFAKDKVERNICIFFGGLLTLWGAMQRFQMFGVAVVLAGGALALYRLWELLREKPEDLKKQVVAYFAVFGTVGILSLLLYFVDYSFYENDESWRAYKEYNETRADLWDTGFPDYFTNTELYDSFGISEADCVYYRSWEMDEDVLTIDVLKQMQAAKAERTFSLGAFLQIFPKAFLDLTPFVLFVVVSCVAIALNKKNIFFVAFEFVVVMALEALFFWMQRYDMERIDSGMWMVAAVTVIYGMSKDLNQHKELPWKWSLAVIGVAAIINIAQVDGYSHIQMGKVGSTKSFYQQVTDDKEHLYVMMTTAPSVYYAYDFWEPSTLGSLSNVYNAFGWEYNLEIKHKMLENYGIKNLYKDSINNDKIYFVAGIKAPDLENYIKENYNENAYLNYENTIEGYFIWSIKVDE